MIKRRYQRQSLSTDISLTPLIDVALTLLVVVMISAPAQHQTSKLNLDQEHLTQSPIIIRLDHTRQLYVNQHPINMNDLTRTLKKYTGSAVRIDINKNLDCSLLAKIIGLIEQASCIKCIAINPI